MSTGKNSSEISDRMEIMALGKRGEVAAEKSVFKKDLGNGNTTQLVGGLNLTENDSVAADQDAHDTVRVEATLFGAPEQCPRHDGRCSHASQL